MATMKKFKENLIKQARGTLTEIAQNDMTIKIDKDDLKEGLGKKRLHPSITDKMKKEFESSGIEIKENCTSEICIIIPKEKLNEDVKSYKEIMGK